jgi:hypothetical protein
MSHNLNGLVYEQTVYKTIKELNHQSIQVHGDEPSGGFNAHDNDLKLSLLGKEIEVEIKANAAAQMGGTSFTYDMATRELKSVKPLPQDDLSVILSETENLYDHFDNLISFLKQSEPVNYHGKNTGFPLAITKESWTVARDNGLLKPINTKIKRTTDFIHNHYAKKGVNYIQIGNAGFFYMKENPLNLPIPQLEGEINLEFRPGRGGATAREFEGKTYKFAGVGLRIQGRLQFKGKSEYSLDNKDSILAMLAKI